MKSMIYIFVLLNYVAVSHAAVWDPGLPQIKIWPGQPPKGGTQPPEKETIRFKNKLVGGKPFHFVENVSEPTMVVYKPAKNSGVAVVVFPGGGHTVLAIDIEGTEVCEWLVQHNIMCVLVKYRVPMAGCHWDDKVHAHVTPPVPMALQDAQRVISMIRFDAKKYGVDPNKIGVMGFSAGGNVTVLASTAFAKRSYERIDEIDDVSSRPDFSIPVFPGHLTMEHKNKRPKKTAARELNTDVKISKDIPPTLIVHAQDDPVDPIHYSEVYVRELRKAGVNVRFDEYKTGGHAFGIRKQGKDTDRWPQDAINWLKELKFL